MKRLLVFSLVACGGSQARAPLASTPPPASAPASSQAVVPPAKPTLPAALAEKISSDIGPIFASLPVKDWWIVFIGDGAAPISAFAVAPGGEPAPLEWPWGARPAGEPTVTEKNGFTNVEIPVESVAMFELPAGLRGVVQVSLAANGASASSDVDDEGDEQDPHAVASAGQDDAKLAALFPAGGITVSTVIQPPFATDTKLAAPTPELRAALAQVDECTDLCRSNSGDERFMVKDGKLVRWIHRVRRPAKPASARGAVAPSADTTLAVAAAKLLGVKGKVIAQAPLDAAGKGVLGLVEDKDQVTLVARLGDYAGMSTLYYLEPGADYEFAEIDGDGYTDLGWKAKQEKGGWSYVSAPVPDTDGDAARAAELAAIGAPSLAAAVKVAQALPASALTPQEACQVITGKRPLDGAKVYGYVEPGQPGISSDVLKGGSKELAEDLKDTPDCVKVTVCSPTRPYCEMVYDPPGDDLFLFERTKDGKWKIAIAAIYRGS